jgi:hypothetical protein
MVELGDLATQDGGDLIGLADGAICIEQALAETVQTARRRKIRSSQYSTCAKKSRCWHLLPALGVGTVRESIGTLLEGDSFLAQAIGQPGVAAAALRKVTTRTPVKASLGQLFIRRSPIPAFSAISCVKSLRATSMRAAKRLTRVVFHAANRGSNAGVTLRATQLGLGKLDRASTQIYWAIATRS